VFGCTGRDAAAGLVDDIRDHGIEKRERFLYSLSSGDGEFYSVKAALLARQTTRFAMRPAINRIPDIMGEIGGSHFTLARAGYPINFDNTRFSVELGLIQGTVCALIGAACQAWSIVRRQGCSPYLSGFQRIMLDVGFQSWLFAQWDRAITAPKTRYVSQSMRAPHSSEVHLISTERTDPPSVDIGDTFEDYPGVWNHRD
jgi:hypothetical protein